MPPIKSYTRPPRSERSRALVRPGEGTRWGRILGTVQEIEPGGRFVTITDQQGNTVTFELPHPSMMAFATRLTRGDDVAVTVFGQN